MTFESNNDGMNKLDDPKGLSLSVAVIRQLVRQQGLQLDLIKCVGLSPLKREYMNT